MKHDTPFYSVSGPAGFACGRIDISGSTPLERAFNAIEHAQDLCIALVDDKVLRVVVGNDAYTVYRNG